MPDWPVVARHATLTVWLAVAFGARAEVTIQDPNLEAAVRQALGQSSGTVGCSNLHDLIVLDASSRGITNLVGLECATNLLELDLTANQIMDPGPIQTLFQLRILGLADNRLGGMDALANLTNLTALTIGRNPISDYSALTNMVQLSELSVVDGSIDDLALLSRLTALTTVRLFRNHVEDVAPLAALTNLSVLDLQWNPITDYEAVLSEATNLSGLYLAGSSIQEVDFLQNLTGLEVLSLAQTGVEDLSPLTPATNLTYLALSQNPVTNYSLISGFTNLLGLELEACAISNLSFLGPLTKLVHLDLAGNCVSDVGPLAVLTNLVVLKLEGNPLTNYVGLGDLTSLKSIWIDGQTNDVVSVLDPLTSLEEISVQKNRLAGLEALESLTNLNRVYAQFNRLTDISTLQSLPKLQQVDLIGNLLSTNAGSPDRQVIDTLSSNGTSVGYLPQNHPPQIIVPSKWYANRDNPFAVPLLVADPVEPAAQLSVTGTSGNPTLVPDKWIVCSGSDYHRSVMLKPTTGSTGQAAIVFTVTDLVGLTNSATMWLTVMEPVYVTNLFSPDSGGLDSSFEQYMRLASGNSQAELTAADLLRMQSLVVVGSDVGSFLGWHWCSNLTSLHLIGEEIDKVDFLPQLPQLRHLSIINTSVTNLSTLSSITNLQTFECSGLAISNLSFLAANTSLSRLTMSRARVTDVSPLAALTNLRSLDLSYNLLTELSPLLGLTNLSSVDLEFNLVDTSPGSTSMAVISSLQAGGAEVDYSPQRTPPVINIVDNWFVQADAASRLSFVIEDNAETPFAGFTAGVTSFDPWLLPVPESPGDLIGISLGPDPNSSQDEWRLLAVPIHGQVGVGTIQLSATNDAGLSSTSNVTVTVSKPWSFQEPFFGMSDLTWQDGGTWPWFGQTAVTLDGAPAAQSGNVGHGAYSSLKSELVGPGLLTFWWKVSSQDNSDWLIFESSRRTNEISGETDWAQVAIPIKPRQQAVRWLYSKDGAGSSGQDAGWLSRVVFTPYTWLDFTGLRPDGTLEMNLYGVTGQEYEILASSNTLDWVTVATVMSTNRVTPCSVSPSSGPLQLYRARALPSTPFLKVSEPDAGGVNVSWFGVGVLEYAPTPGGPWMAIGGVSPVSISVELAPSQFFRLKVVEH